MRSLLQLITWIALLHISQSAGVSDRRLMSSEPSPSPSPGKPKGCPAGCLTGKCIEDKTTSRFICTKCANNLVVIKSNNPDVSGQCGCRAGRYYASTGGSASDVTNNNPTCTICPKGSFCPGGLIAAAVEIPCTDIGGAKAQPGLTTAIAAARSKWACVERPGWGYKVVNNNPTASKCDGDTYSTGFSKKACQACPTGFQIDDVNKTSDPVVSKHDSVKDCMVPPGYFQRGPSEVAPCPQGEYQPTFNRANKCFACPIGVTTARGKINVDAQYCNTLKPGYFAYDGLKSKTISDDTGHNYFMDQDAKLCPQKHWCPGGTPSATYSNITSAPDSGTTKVFCCSEAYQAAAGTNAAPLWTKGQGAKSKHECLVPPGFGKDSNGAVHQCTSGYFREGWVQPDDAEAACQKCAETDPDAAVTSEATESLLEYSSLDNADSSAVLVIGSSGACQMKPGYGMYQTAQGMRVAACKIKSYGSANVTHGRSINPCRQCPTNMVTPANITAADAAIKNADDTGYTSPLACITQPGYGFDGRVSTQCPVGSYNSGGNRDQCTECPFGFSTEDAAEQQVTADDCLVAAGYEADVNGTTKACPFGTYSSSLTPIGVPCTACGRNRWTFETGSTSESDCTACAPGYGKAASANYTDLCDDCARVAGYGPASRDSTECKLCPTQQAGFTFLYNDNTEPFRAAPAISSAQTSATMCLSQFAQIESGLWYLRGADQQLGNFTGDESGINACSALCTGKCMFFSFDYSTGDCFARMHNDIAVCEELLAFKAVPSSDIAGAQQVGARAVSSGIYTEWYVSTATADAVGTSAASIGSKTKADCMAACDTDGLCAGVRMAGLCKGSPVDATAGCAFIYGESNAGQLAADGKLFSRSLTRAVVKGAACSGNPPSPANGSFDCGSSSLPGSTCNATCLVGYRGSPAATCGADGSWGAVQGSCDLDGPCVNDPCSSITGAVAGSCVAQNLTAFTCNCSDPSQNEWKNGACQAKVAVTLTTDRVNKVANLPYCAYTSNDCAYTSKTQYDSCAQAMCQANGYTTGTATAYGNACSDNLVSGGAYYYIVNENVIRWAGLIRETWVTASCT